MILKGCEERIGIFLLENIFVEVFILEKINQEVSLGYRRYLGIWFLFDQVRFLGIYFVEFQEVEIGIVWFVDFDFVGLGLVRIQVGGRVGYRRYYVLGFSIRITVFVLDQIFFFIDSI